MVKLTSLRIRNYKAFEDSTFIPDSSGLTVVIGTNASGKTSLWEVLSLLARLAAGWQVRWLERQFGGRGRGFVGCLPWHQADRECKIEIKLEFGDFQADHEAIYEVGWIANRETGQPELGTEVLTCDGKELLRFDRTTGRYISDIYWFFLEKNYPLILSSMGRQPLAQTPYASLKRAFDGLARWGVFRFRVLDLGKDFKDIDITSGFRDQLTVTGENLPLVLHAWKENPEKTPFGELRTLVRVMLDRAGLKDVDWDIHTEVAGGSAYAFLRFHKPGQKDSDSLWFDMAFGPDGFKAYFQVMTALLSGSPLVAIEEAESHLEPRMLDLVAGQMTASASAGTQIVITTHSPVLAQAVPPENIRVLRKGRFEPVPDSVKQSKRVMDAWLTDVLHEADSTV
jgi:hypothetical protein